jgi:Cu/Ag efflux protein CusF
MKKPPFAALFHTLLYIAALCAATGYAAGHGHSHSSHSSSAAAEPAQPEFANRVPQSHQHPGALAEPVAGTVKKVDKAAGKLTVSHEPLPNLGMPAMTMVFRVTDAKWLDQVKAGDKVRFAAQSVGGVLTIVHLEMLEASK